MFQTYLAFITFSSTYAFTSTSPATSNLSSSSPIFKRSLKAHILKEWLRTYYKTSILNFHWKIVEETRNFHLLLGFFFFQGSERSASKSIITHSLRKQKVNLGKYVLRVIENAKSRILPLTATHHFIRQKVPRLSLEIALPFPNTLVGCGAPVT